MAEIVVDGEEAARLGGVVRLARLPLAPLHHQRRVGDQRVAADMIEMEMRGDDEVDLARVAVDRLEPRADLGASGKSSLNICARRAPKHFSGS